MASIQSPEECAAGVGKLADRIAATLRTWGPLSVPTLAVKLGVAPLHIRDAVEVSDDLVVERDLVHLRESCTTIAVEAHLAVHGSLTLDALAMAVGRSLAAVRNACRRSKRVEVTTRGSDLVASYRGARA